MRAAVDEHRLPAMAVLVAVDGEVVAEEAIGVRATDRAAAVTTADRWHLGSDTKAMTATMIARLVERGELSFDVPIGDYLPELRGTMHPAYRGVTLAQLLTHRAGMPALTDGCELATLRRFVAGVRGVRAQRLAAARGYLSAPPAVEPGREFLYSNVGYIVAAVVAERRTGRSWEELMRAEIFEPLSMTSAGFGAPSAARGSLGPLGHAPDPRGPRPRSAAAERRETPPLLGPAGDVHASLRDWLRFVQDQIDGAHGRGRLLSADGYRRLHAPPVDGATYAMGWGVKSGADGSPLVLVHSGSNGNWFADLRLLPAERKAILIVINIGGEAAAAAAKQVRTRLAQALQ